MLKFLNIIILCVFLSISIAEAKKNCFEEAPLNYRTAFLGEYKKGTKITFTGQIIQRIDGKQFRIATKSIEYAGYVDNIVYVSFVKQQKLMEDDIVEICGEYIKTDSYTTVLGSELEIPIIAGSNFKIITMAQ